MTQNQVKTMLQVENLSVNYGDFQAIQGVSLVIPEGSIVSIIGSNGAGKSTLLNTIMGINKPREGSIAFENQLISGMPTRETGRFNLLIIA